MVKDMDKAVDFYTVLLGLKPGKRYGNHWAEIEAPGVLLGLHPLNPNLPEVNISVNPAAPSIGFNVADLDKAKALLDNAGISYLNLDDTMLNFAMFNDPDGNPLYFCQYKYGV